MSSKKSLRQVILFLNLVLAVILAVSPVLAAPSSEALSGARALAMPVEAQPALEHRAMRAQNQPDALAHPLSVARTQSSFTPSGDDLTITYTVRNTLSPQSLPDIAPGTSMTGTVAALAAFDFGADPNTLRNVILVASPTASSAIVGTSQPADVDDGLFVFQLGNLPPQASATIVVTATTPATVNEATPLVNATGWASLAGRAVSAAAAPALVLPPALGNWLISTMDANTADEEMLAALAPTGGDPAAIFGLVRAMGFEAYSGSLRGTRGTLWSGAGNSLDQSSLLVAMLRASGVPARYRHGALSQADAQALIASMFPAPTSVLGRVAPELPTSDPVNDPQLIAEVQDHWWVEAYIAGGWTDLDPSFAAAAVGQIFASQIANDGTDRIAEVPDSFRPKVTIKLEIESYNQLNIGGLPVAQTRLEHTFRIVEIATASVVLANTVTSETQGGLVFANTIHTFTPFLHINDIDQIILGEPYQELLTNFPLATTLVTGAWLLFEIEDVDGNVTQYRRTLRDRLGYDIRTYGGTPDIAIDDTSAGIFSEFDIYSVSFFPGLVPSTALEARRAAMTGVVSELASDATRLQELAALEPLDAIQQAEASQLRARYQVNLSLFLNGVSLSFAEAADRASQIAQEAFFVKAYHDDPRLIIISHEVVDDAAQINVDLRTTLERAIAHPGQGIPATFGFNLFKGINESWLEGEVIGAAAADVVLTAARVMQAAYEQGIDFVFISQRNLDVLPTLGLSSEAQARITSAALDGKLINLPVAAPLINGEPAIGWWEIDPATGETIGVMENGLHNAALEYIGNLLFGTTVGRFADFMIGATAATWDFLGKQVFKATGSGAFGTPAKDAMGTFNNGLSCLMGDIVGGCAGQGKGYLDYGYMAMEALLDYLDSNDPPLPDILLGGVRAAPGEAAASATVAVAANLSPGAIAANVQTDFVQTTEAGGSLSFYAAALDPLASGASGAAPAVNHVTSADLTLAGAELRLAAPVGTVTVAGQPVAAGGGLAIAGFDGSLAIAVASPDSDQVVLSGSGDLFSVTNSPASSMISPVQTATFDVVLAATASDAFTVTVAAPSGWQVAIDGAGQVTATPPAGAAADVYELAVTAQSAAFPALILSAMHTVTVTPYAVWSLDVRPDPLITVPMGPRLNDSAFINTGQAQVPGAAYIIELNNTANVPHSYTVTVSGLPAGWTLLGGESGATTTLALPPGASGQIGLYVTPNSLPPAGTAHSIVVTAVDQNSVSAQASASFVMPAVPFSYVEASPSPQAVTSTGSVVYDVAVHNVGNAAGTFGLTAEAFSFDGSVSFGALPAPVALAAGDSAAFPVTVSTNGAPTRSRVLLFFGSPVANTVYTPAATAELLVASAEAEPFVNAVNVCPLPAAQHAAYLALAAAVDELSFWCEQGNCPLVLRDRVVAAGQALAGYAASAAQPTVLPALNSLDAALADLASQTNNAGILAAVADLGNAAYALSGESCEVEQHRVAGRFTPYVQAILLGDAAGFSLDVTNQGTVATTYAITVTGLPGGDLTFNPTIAAGATASLPVNPTPAVLGSFDLTAEIVAVAPDVTLDIRRNAAARLNVVDRFVQVTQVSADPPFVETGASSTDLSVEVANIAGVAQAATAQIAILAPSGAVQWSGSAALTILAGNPRVYDLETVDTSGWAAGVYTITVDLLDGGNAPLPDGSGYGYLGVGQAVQVSQAVYPQIVAPGVVTVTTVITSQINGQLAMVNGQLAVVNGQLAMVNGQLPMAEEGAGRTMYDAPLTAADAVYLNRAAPVEQANTTGDQLAPALLGGPAPTANDGDDTLITPALRAGASVDNRPLTIDNSLPLTPVYSDTTAISDSLTIDNWPLNIDNFPPAFTRGEQDDPAWSYTGTWTNVTLQRASGGSHWRNATAGSTATLTFDGTWISLGFIADRFSGYAEVFIDAVSQGVIDLYRNEETPVSFLYDGMSAGTHTLTVAVQGSANPFASNTRVQLDYADYGDGSALPDGSFEQDDARLLRSNGWGTTTYAGASGGSFITGSTATAWFPFAGDSFSLHTIAYSSAGQARLFVDGVYLDTINMFAPVFSSAGIPRVFSYDSLGAGPHILQIMTYQGVTSIDKLVTPGAAPFIDPNPPVSGVTRFEADHPSILYNGVPFTQTASSWVRVADINANRASAGEYIYSATANNTISFTFEGPWLGVGFATDTTGGRAEIAIDGQPVQTVDLYSRADDTASFYFDDLGAGPHTATVTVLGTSHPNATGARVYLDFFDVWDGLPLPTGTFEEDSDRLLYSNGWGRTLAAGASDGAYGVSGVSLNSTAWFPFTGDSVTYQGWTRYTYQDVELRIDGVSLGQFDLYSLGEGTRAYSFDNLGAGPHVLEIRRYRSDTATVDALITPAIGPAYEPPAPAAIVRYEEDHPAMRYNGHPYRTRPQSWGEGSTFQNSAGYNASTSTAGNVWSLDFTGRWLNIGFRSSASSGTANIIIDGVSQGVFDTANGVNSVKTVTFDLAPGAHQVQVVVASGTVMPDYMDVWDGQTVAGGWYDAQLENEASGLFHFSQKQWWQRATNIYAYNGDFLNSFVGANINIWFTFVGSDLTVLGHNLADTELTVVIDGVNKGVFNMAATPPFSNQPYALHFPGLGEGPHVVQVFVPANRARIDAFEVDPASFTSYTPVVEWYDQSATQSLPGAINTGFASTIAIGDLNGDGVVELVAPGLNGRLYVYRGDGQDAGGGTPVTWTSDLVGPAAEPALADLTGDGMAEIIVSGRNGTFAFRHDGALLWSNPAVIAYYPNEDIGWGGPTVGNLDLSPEPEIVIVASSNALYVLNHLGAVQWSTPLTDRFAPPPVLADITGDGILDIVMADQWQLRVYDYFNGGQVVWSRTLPDPINVLGGAGAFGPPAVADLTGDGRPEIIMNWGHIVEALRDDGTVLWRYLTNSTTMYRPSPITVADVTGDGQVDIVTASAISSGFLIFNHLLMVLDRQGNLVWSQLVADNTASASGVAAQDLTGNGVWEILWNGATDGFLVIRGSDGKRLFNEPYTGSGTVLDYPTLADVDGDGQAEVVVSGRNGLFVIGHSGRWTDSRPLWNQHNYHVTNINDDWSVPVNEPNSWALHNTYRTQTPDRTPAPAYQMVFTYTEGSPNVTVLTGTASIPLTAAPPLYTWDYHQEWYQPTITTTFDSLLTALQPGESRQVSAGTEVAYRLPSGFNYLTLPPLYVTAARLGELAPPSQSVAAGSTAVYTLTLTNPGSAAAVYSLAASGLPAGWLSYPATLPLAPGQSVEVLITVTTPPDAQPDTLPLLVDVDNGSGGDTMQASLTIFTGLALALDPASQQGPTGQPLSYQLLVQNLEAEPRTYDLSAAGLADVALPAQVTVAANSTETITLSATPGSHGPQPFTVQASAANGVQASVDGVAVGVGRYGVLAQIDPALAITGPGATAVYTVSVSNVGDTADDYSLTVDAPAGWATELTLLGAPASQVSLPATLFNTVDLLLAVTPPVGAAPGVYPLSVTAQSLSQPAVSSTAAAEAQVDQRGVSVAIGAGRAPNLDPSQPAAWDVVVTNRGSQPDTFALQVAGALAPNAQLSTSTVTLGAGAAQTVQLTASNLLFLLPGPHTFAVEARSQADNQIRAQAVASFTVDGYEDVIVAWQPVSQTVNSLSATFTLLITNTGNLPTEYATAVSGAGLTAAPAFGSATIPPRSAAINPVTLAAGDVGTYPFTGSARSTSNAANASAAGTLVIACPASPDVNGDGEVTVLDISAIAERWYDADNYSALHDVNCDGVIDIVDIMLATAAFGN